MATTHASDEPHHHRNGATPFDEETASVGEIAGTGIVFLDFVGCPWVEAALDDGLRTPHHPVQRGRCSAKSSD
jgi:hypothetical protein